jgi:hypothetical protein
MGLMADPSRTEYDRGKEAGRAAQVEDEFRRHFIDINGSVARTADTLAELASEMRTMREEARLRDERVAVAADTLATETERRRSELADTTTSADRRFTRREKQIGWALTVGIPALLYVAANPPF